MSFKTQDPKERYTKALQLLAAKFYQNAFDFNGEMSGIFSKYSDKVKLLEKHRDGVLQFEYQQEAF